MWPSASARATALVPMMPDPPARFSTTIDWSSSPAPSCAIRRAKADGAARRIGHDDGDRSTGKALRASGDGQTERGEAGKNRTAIEHGCPGAGWRAELYVLINAGSKTMTGAPRLACSRASCGG